MRRQRLIFGVLLGLAAGCATMPDLDRMAVQRAAWGKTAEGEAVALYTLTNANGMTAQITNYGGIVVALTARDRHGRYEDVVLGFDSLQGYLAGHPYFGAIVSRYANRIAHGRFTRDGEVYALATNNGHNALHGGERGFDKRVWQATPFEEADAVGLTLTRRSPDGEEGYPGTLDVTVTYRLLNDDALRIDYEAVTDAPTVVNLSNHSYFNLNGAGAGDILGHEVRLFASHYTPVDATLIPTGEIATVADTPLDFRTAKAIGRDIGVAHNQLVHGGGYDHNFVLDKDTPGALRLAAEVYAPDSGRAMAVHTTAPGVQFYTGNFLDGSHVGKGGVAYEHRAGFCLETQHFPDSPNQPAFPSTVLRPGERYTQTTLYQFDALRGWRLDTRDATRHNARLWQRGRYGHEPT